MATEEEKVQEPELKEESEDQVVSEPESLLETDLEDTSEHQEDLQSIEDNNENNMELLYDLELPVSVELARKDMLIRNILHLGEGSVVEFDKMAGENVDLLVNNKRIATGEVVVIDDRFGIRIANLVNPSERIKGITS